MLSFFYSLFNIDSFWFNNFLIDNTPPPPGCFTIPWFDHTLGIFRFIAFDLPEICTVICFCICLLSFFRLLGVFFKR